MKVFVTVLFIVLCGSSVAAEPATTEAKGQSQNLQSLSNLPAQGDWTFSMEDLNKKLGKVDSAVLTLKSDQETIELTFSRKPNGLFKIDVNRQLVKPAKSNQSRDNPSSSQSSPMSLDLIRFFVPPPTF